MTSDESTNFWVDAPYNDRIPSLSPYRQYSTVRLSFPRPDEFSRLALALQMGATSVVAASGDELLEVADQVDVLLECSGSPDALEAGLRVLGPAARAVVVGMSPDPRVPVALALVQRQEVELTGTFRYANTYPTAMALASSGAIHLDDLVTGHYGLAQVAEALSVGRRDPLAVKPVVLPGRDTA